MRSFQTPPTKWHHGILAEFNLAVRSQIRQFAKLNSPPNFLAIRYAWHTNPLTIATDTHWAISIFRAVRVLRLISTADTRTESLHVLISVLPACTNKCVACMYLFQPSLLSAGFPMKHHPWIVATLKWTVKNIVATALDRKNAVLVQNGYIPNTFNLCGNTGVTVYPSVTWCAKVPLVFLHTCTSTTQWWLWSLIPHCTGHVPTPQFWHFVVFQGSPCNSPPP